MSYGVAERSSADLESRAEAVFHLDVLLPVRLGRPVCGSRHDDETSGKNLNPTTQYDVA